MNLKLTFIIYWTILAGFGLANSEIIKQEPIVIKTPLANYPQPNFDDYKTCMKALDSCTQSCDGEEDCLSKCIKCPVLIKQDVVVQGVNDTDSKTITTNHSLNTTNVIRVTNEIHNIIENNLGDIQTKNENNVNIYQDKTNSACDKYGLGCNENGTCCYIVRNRHREKHCGKVCQARVMLEKTVVQCLDESNPDSCKKIIEYKPLRSKKLRPVTDNYRCRYDSKWPFVYCHNRKPINERCSSICLSLSYLYILQHGIPLHCASCYKSFGESSKDFAPPIIDDDNMLVDNHDKEWILEKTKCRREDGTISENCAKDKNEIINDNELGSGDNGGNDFENPALASFNALDTTRNEFRPSKYSLRHKRNQIKNQDEEI